MFLRGKTKGARAPGDGKKRELNPQVAKWLRKSTPCAPPLPLQTLKLYASSVFPAATGWAKRTKNTAAIVGLVE